MISIPLPEVNMFTRIDDSSVWMLETAVRRRNTEDRSSHMYDTSMMVHFEAVSYCHEAAAMKSVTNSA
jgi:hypothetical protein